jgi:spore coat polysaccharide biosynthesis protein SpsF (cytidylyltransferase family)
MAIFGKLLRFENMRNKFKVKVVRMIRVTADNPECAKDAIKDIKGNLHTNGCVTMRFRWEYTDGAKVTVMRNKKGGAYGRRS